MKKCKNKYKNRFFALFALMIMACSSVFVLSAGAADAVEQNEQKVEEEQQPPQEEATVVPVETQAPQNQEQEQQRSQEDNNQNNQNNQNDIEVYAQEYTDAPQEKKDELPQVSSEKVIEATTVKLPDVKVSDTTLIGGVIAWLCVAVGIAVIAGVLVSKRTRRKK